MSVQWLNEQMFIRNCDGEACAMMEQALNKAVDLVGRMLTDDEIMIVAEVIFEYVAQPSKALH